MGSIPGLVRFPGVGNGSSLQYSSLENSVDRGAWRAAVLGFTESETTKRLSARAHTHTHTHTHTHSLLSTWLRIVKMILIVENGKTEQIRNPCLPLPPPVNFLGKCIVNLILSKGNKKEVLGWKGFPGGAGGKEPAYQYRRRKVTRVQTLVGKDALEEGMATHSSILAWKNPLDRGTWWTTVHGVPKTQTPRK